MIFSDEDPPLVVGVLTTALVIAILLSALLLWVLFGTWIITLLTPLESNQAVLLVAGLTIGHLFIAYRRDPFDIVSLLLWSFILLFSTATVLLATVTVAWLTPISHWNSALVSSGLMLLLVFLMLGKSLPLVVPAEAVDNDFFEIVEDLDGALWTPRSGKSRKGRSKTTKRRKTSRRIRREEDDDDDD